MLQAAGKCKHSSVNSRAFDSRLCSLRKSTQVMRHLCGPRASCKTFSHNPAEQHVVATSSCENNEPDWRVYRRAVGCCLFSPLTGHVFAATRSDSGCNSWQMPQGGINEGEAPEAAVLRELEEETCVRSARIVTSIDRWLTYDHPQNVKARLPKGWEHLRGQAQKWFLVAFEGDESEINLDTPDREFSNWQWMPLHELPDSVVPFKRHVYEEMKPLPLCQWCPQVVTAFNPMIRSMHQQHQQRQ